MNTENNKIIAEFLGLENELFNTTLFYYTLGGCLDENSLKFHSDWNWLMEVVEKISSLSNNNSSILHWSRNNWTVFDIIITNAKIEAVYNACVEFIKWYNQQEK